MDKMLWSVITLSNLHRLLDDAGIPRCNVDSEEFSDNLVKESYQMVNSIA